MNNGLWFRRKRYGWGWTPTTWQGWAMVIIFIAVMTLGGWLLIDSDSTAAQLLLFYGWTFIAVLVLFIVSYKKGPAPRWQWGKEDESDR